MGPGKAWVSAGTTVNEKLRAERKQTIQAFREALKSRQQLLPRKGESAASYRQRFEEARKAAVEKVKPLLAEDPGENAVMLMSLGSPSPAAAERLRLGREWVRLLTESGALRLNKMGLLKSRDDYYRSIVDASAASLAPSPPPPPREGSGKKGEQTEKPKPPPDLFRWYYLALDFNIHIQDLPKLTEKALSSDANFFIDTMQVQRPDVKEETDTPEDDPLARSVRVDLRCRALALNTRVKF